MYLLGSQEVADLFSRDPARPVLHWIHTASPRESDLFASVVSIGQAIQMVEEMALPERDHWRRLLAAGRRSLESRGSVIGIDLAIVDVWASTLRGRDLVDLDPVSGEPFLLGEDDRLVIATAIARNYSLVTRRTALLDEIASGTMLSIVEPAEA